MGSEDEDFDAFSQHFIDKYREKSAELRMQSAFATTNESTLNGEPADSHKTESHQPRTPIERLSMWIRPLSEAVGVWRKLIAKESRWRDASDAEAKTLR